MKAYILKVLGVFIIIGVGEILLPEGNLRKYAKVLFGILVCSVLLSPTGIMPEFSFDISPESAGVYDSYKESVLAEYKKRIEENILNETGTVCRVFLNDDGSIEKITAEDDGATLYLTGELGVMKDDIEIGKD